MKKSTQKLIDRILEISKLRGTTHIGSCITAVPIMEEVYSTLQKDDIFVLSSGHSFLAWAAVLEAFKGIDAFALAEKYGTHPDRDTENGLTISSGSLGHGLGISIGMALANRKRAVHCLMTDGEVQEGSVWEALRIKEELKLDNLKVHVNINGYSALGEIDVTWLTERLVSFCPDVIIHLTDNAKIDWLKGVSAHYVKTP